MSDDTRGVVRGTPGLGMGGHHAPNRGEKDEWLTPPEILAALGPFDLDPCAPVCRPWHMASHHLTVEDDGLSTSWDPGAFVWCNPPYGPQTWVWLDRLADHPAGGIALVFARTETAGFFSRVWRRADTLLFIEGRLFFHHVEGTRASHNSGAPSVLVAYGQEASTRLSLASSSGSIAGALVDRWTA